MVLKCFILKLTPSKKKSSLCLHLHLVQLILYYFILHYIYIANICLFFLISILAHPISLSPLSCRPTLNLSSVQPHIADPYLSPILYLMDGKLHRNVEAVQNIASKHQCVLGSVDSMDPALIANIYKKIRDTTRILANSHIWKHCAKVRESLAPMFSEVAANLFLLATLKQPCQHTRWDEEGVSLLKLHSLASISSVSQEDVTLLAWQDPVLVKGKVMRGWRHEPKHLRGRKSLVIWRLYCTVKTGGGEISTLKTVSVLEIL